MTWALGTVGVVTQSGTPQSTPGVVHYPTANASDIIVCFATQTIASVSFTFSDVDFSPIVIRSSNATTGLWWKVSNGTESGNTFTITSNNNTGGLYAQAASFTGGPAAATVGNVAASATTGGSPATGLGFPALTVPNDHCLILVAGTKLAPAQGFNVPGAFSAELSEAHVSSQCMVWDYITQSTAANIAAGSWTIGSGDASATRAAVIAALLPKASGPPPGSRMLLGVGI